MVEHKKLGLLTLFLLFFTLSVTAIEFRVSVSDIVEHNQVELEYNDTVNSVQNITTTVENTGSIGCKYRIRAQMARKDNRTEVAWSKPKGLWPGDSETFDVRYMPLNYTGEINSSMYINYCGQEKNFRNFSFEVDRKQVAEREVKSNLLESNSTNAKISTEKTEGVLIPKKVPSKWRVSHAEIKEGEATLEYEAPLFSEQRTIEYTVLDRNGSTFGTIEVDLAEKPPLYHKLRENRFAVLFIASTMVNLMLILKILGLLPGRLQSFKDE